jgi:glycogen operon protein
MLLAGDECRRTQQGNNNAWCQDNATSWFDWQLVSENEDLVRFCRALVAFRKRQPTVRRATFLAGMPQSPGSLPDVTWFNADGRPMGWSHGERSLQCLYGPWPVSGASSLSARPVLVLLHSDWAPREFTLPSVGHHIHWRLFVNTSADTPDDIYPGADGPSPVGNKLTLLGHTLVCYVA